MKKPSATAMVWFFVLGLVASTMPAEALQRRAPKSAPNRKQPDVQPVPQAPSFSTWPTDEEIFRARVFSEPLVPIGATTPEENAALARALTAYLQNGGGERTADLEALLESRKVSPWRASLRLNLGSVYRRTGYFIRALRAWEEAWAIAKDASNPRGRAVADRALGELAQLHARLGNRERLEQLFVEIEGRDVGGTAGELLTGARQGLWEMQNQPERAYRCGPLALGRILASVKPDYKDAQRIHLYPSTSRGTTLLEVRALATEFELPLQAAFRSEKTARVLVPALVHWKAGHFAALVKEENGRYLIQDPTFGQELWISRSAFDEEASGFMLVREGALPRGWKPVSDAEAATIRGKGATPQSDQQQQKCSSNQSGGNPMCCRGLASYSFHTMLVNLHLTDTPVGYNPPRGPAIDFNLNYNQREVFQPQTFSYGNVGPKWNFSWQSYIEDDPVTPSQPANLYVRGGGQETYTGYNAGTQSYARHSENRALVVRVSTSPVRYERRLVDGFVEEYGQPDGALTFPRKVFLTKRTDPQGNSVTFTYDSSLRLVGVTDAIGQVTTLSYELPGDPLKVTKVTDPFGRFATLGYDGAGRLTSITDVIGMVSSFQYGPSDFINVLTTPYGNTTFTGADSGRRRWLEATDPLGGTERLEYVNIDTDAAAGAEAATAMPYGASAYPTGYYPGQYTNYNTRNTFFWSKLAMAREPGKYTAAKLVHWLHVPSLTQTSGVIENEKEPLESMRTFYKYPDQSWQITGSFAQPSGVARVTEDGSSQIYQYEYNARGRKTKEIDPLGRETVYVYGTNNVPDANPTTGDGIDLLQVKQKIGGSYAVLVTYTYNVKHQSLTVTDASGQTTTYTYLPDGRVQTMVSPPRGGLSVVERTTTYTYYPDTDPAGPGRLHTVTGPSTAQGAPTATYTYDGYGRVRTETNADGHSLTYDYDQLDRVTKLTYPDGSYRETVYKWLDAEKQRDRQGRWKYVFHDALRRVVASRDTAGRTTQYQYGGSGCSSCSGGGDKLTRLVDPNGNATSWDYDVQGRVTTETRPNQTQWQYAYEASTGRLKTTTDPKGNVKTNAYNLDRTLASITYAVTGGTSATPTVSFGYDSVFNRLASMSDGTGTTIYTYRPVSSPPTAGAGRIQSIDGPLQDDTIEYSYDELGRISTQQGPGSEVENRAYDSLGRLRTVTNALGGAFTYDYDGVSGRVTSLTYPNGQTTAYAYYDHLGDFRLREIHHRAPGGATLSKFTYTYDSVGNVLTWSQQEGSAPAKLYELAYDDSNRLTTATLRTTDAVPQVLKRYGYAFDPAGNRTAEQIDDAATSATYDSMNRLLSQQAGGALVFGGSVSEPATVTIAGKVAPVTSDNRFVGQAIVPEGTSTVGIIATDPAGNVRTNTYQINQAVGGVSFTYDLNGNMTSDGTFTYEWDGENRLVAVMQSGQPVAQYAYNGTNLRTSRTTPEGTTSYVLQGVSVAEERPSVGPTLRLYRGRGLDDVLGTREASGSTKYFTRDHLGSIREQTDTAGAVTLRRDYDPWGTPLAGSGTSGGGFTGREDEAGLGLQYYRARYYAPRIGRFLSEDPIGLAGGLNRYAYADGTPARKTDPLGWRAATGPVDLCPASNFAMPGGGTANASTCCRNGTRTVCYNQDFFWKATPTQRECTAEHEMVHIYDMDAAGCKNCDSPPCVPEGCLNWDNMKSECAAFVTKLQCLLDAGDATSEEIDGTLRWIWVYCFRTRPRF